MEAVSFELLSAAFAQAKIERTEYEVAMEHRRREMDRLMTPAQPVQLAIPSAGPSTVPTLRPSHEQESSDGPQTFEQGSTSSRVIAQLPRRHESDASTGTTSGKFSSWSGFSANSVEGYVDMQKGLKVAIDILTATGDDRYSLQAADAKSELLKSLPEVAEVLEAEDSQSKDDSPADDTPANDTSSSALTKLNIEDPACVIGDDALPTISLDVVEDQRDVADSEQEGGS